MRKRTDEHETFATETFTLQSGRDIYVYPLSPEVSYLSLKAISEGLKADLKRFADKDAREAALAGAVEMTDIQATALMSDVLFALSVDDPAYVFECDVPENPVLLTPTEWLTFAKAVSTEIRSRKGRSIYTAADVSGVVQAAQKHLQAEVADEKNG